MEESAKRIRDWLIRNDLKFAYSLRSLSPEEAGKRICKAYNIDISHLKTEKEIVEHIANTLEESTNDG